MNPRHCVFGILVALLVFCFAYPLNAQTNQPSTKQTITAKPEKVYVQTSQPESTKQLDRTISILNTTITAIGVLVGLITLVFMVAIAVGFFEIRKWQAIRKRAEQYSNAIKKKKEEVDEISKSVIHPQLISSKQLLIDEKPPDEMREILDELSKKLEILEALGSELSPDNYINKGLDFYYKGKYEIALHAFEKALALTPNNGYVWDIKGVVLTALGKYEEALKAHEKAIALTPGSPYAWSNKGVALNWLGKHAEALKAHERAIELMPNDSNSWVNKGIELGELGNYEDSLKAFEKALELMPNSANAWDNKGVSLSKLGKFVESIQAHDKTIELMPNNANAWDNKGYTLCKMGKHAEALEAFDKALNLKPNFSEAWYNKAYAYLLLKENKKVFNSLNKAIELDCSYKEKAKKDEDFKTLWDDPEFKKIVS
jgi:tetratricopeptide (TPR) repeat protein